MNKVKLFIGLVMTICIFSSCSCNDCDSKLYTTSAKIYLINETSVVIKSVSNSLGYIIQPGDTLIHTESHTNEYGEKPSIDNYDPFATLSGSRLFIYGDNSKCELGLHKIENYENRKEVNPLEFEFTFRFTEEKKAKAQNCN
jgi:hypothetical protein